MISRDAHPLACAAVSQVDVFFGQDDLLWANAFPAPRFGLGAFRRALSHLYEEATRCPLTISAMYGKPTLKPYRLAKNVLDMQAQKEGEHSLDASIWIVLYSTMEHCYC